jgi:hypothetical protein
MNIVERINKLIEEKRINFELTETEPISIILNITESEREEFYNEWDQYNDRYSWDFSEDHNGNETLDISYSGIIEDERNEPIGYEIMEKRENVWVLISVVNTEDEADEAIKYYNDLIPNKEHRVGEIYF